MKWNDFVNRKREIPSNIERLEKLCARMFRLLEMSAKLPATVSSIEPTRREMQALGLLEVD